MDYSFIIRSMECPKKLANSNFESLSYQYSFLVRDFPKSWYPLIQLYDPDMPLFPLQYFHLIPSEFSKNNEYTLSNRIYGYINRINISDVNVEISITTNKDLENDPIHTRFRNEVEAEIKERLGVTNPVTLNDIRNTFSGSLTDRNEILEVMWKRVIKENFDNKLPFGRLYDKIFGLIRFIASYRSPAGRKSELIMTQYFFNRFGEIIECRDRFLKMDFRLFPTYEEFKNHCLDFFPKFNSLNQSVEAFHKNFCLEKRISKDLTFSKFMNPYKRGGTFYNPSNKAIINTEKLLEMINSLEPQYRRDLIEAYNAFDKGPQRTLIFINIFKDIYNNKYNPEKLGPSDFEIIYDKLKGFTQSHKVIEIYAQQCFGNIAALPLDTWITAYLDYPLNFLKTQSSEDNIYHNSISLGKTERLLWISAQARKIHSPLCNDVLWCIKYDSSRETRGANPLSCAACKPSFRMKCPSFLSIKNRIIEFNKDTDDSKITIETVTNYFTNCFGVNAQGGIISDDFSPVDAPDQYKSYPQKSLHNGEDISVREFIKIYSNNFDTELED